MFTTSFDQLIISLEILRKRLCGYGSGPHGPCDCKFIRATENPEATGCVEIRQAINMLINVQNAIRTPPMIKTNDIPKLQENQDAETE